MHAQHCITIHPPSQEFLISSPCPYSLIICMFIRKAMVLYWKSKALRDAFVPRVCSWTLLLCCALGWVQARAVGCLSFVRLKFCFASFVSGTCCFQNFWYWLIFVLPRSIFVYFADLAGNQFAASKMALSSPADSPTSDLSLLPPHNILYHLPPNHSLPLHKRTTCHSRSHKRPHTHTQYLHPGHTTAHTDLPRPRWVNEFQPQLRWRWWMWYMHRPQTHVEDRRARVKQLEGSDIICPCR